MKTGAGLTTLFRFAPVVFVLSFWAAPAPAQDAAASRWSAVGPEGGDVRALGLDPTDPRRVYLGTASGVLYRSDTAGLTWRRLSPGFPRGKQSLDSIVVNERGTVLIGFWDVSGRGGGVAKSADGGLTFTLSLDGESVRALSVAPSDGRLVFAGSLDGVFSSADEGASWRRISPKGHLDLRNVESLAVDPRNPRRIYVGTRHLPWRTLNGGETWRSVPRGMIEDSDVFTITLDRRDPERVHATACSGIYGSRNGALGWSRVRGMPYGSRRARAFAQDATRPDTFYAGTTEGLWVSSDDTLTWSATTPLDMVVNEVVSLQDGSVLAGTDGAGVLRSIDRGRTWTSSNLGFSERFVSKVLFDPAGNRFLAGIWGDRVHGGVFAAQSAAGPWLPLGEGLKGREVLSLGVLGASVLVGTDRGLFALAEGGGGWRPLAFEGLAPRIVDLAGTATLALAATPLGVFRSSGCCGPWALVLGGGGVSAVALSEDGQLALAATQAGLRLSRDRGVTWTAIGGARFGRVNAIAILPGPRALILAATHRGLGFSSDEGLTWTTGALGLPDSDYTSLAVAANGETMFVSDFEWGGVFRSVDRGVSWSRLSSEGLVTDRVWTLALGPTWPAELLAGALAGGLHVLR